MMNCEECGEDITELDDGICDVCRELMLAMEIDEILRKKLEMEYESKLVSDAEIDLYLAEPQGEA